MWTCADKKAFLAMWEMKTHVLELVDPDSAVVHEGMQTNRLMLETLCEKYTIKPAALITDGHPISQAAEVESAEVQ